MLLAQLEWHKIQQNNILLVLFVVYNLALSDYIIKLMFIIKLPDQFKSHLSKSSSNRFF